MNTRAPVSGGVRKRRTKMPMLQGNGDSSVVRYSSLGTTLATGTLANQGAVARFYIPGYPADLVNGSGASVCSFYSTAKFLPGTGVRWEPSVSFTTAGRLIVGFTDNPEVIAAIDVLKANIGTTYAPYLAAVKGLGSVRSFPAWQETSITFPTRLRRKRFDCNATVNVQAIDVLDRCCQTVMFVAVEGAPASTTLGSFWYHDVVDVEGVTGVIT